MSDAAINLPWQIQLSLASGYAAYLLSFVGIRSKHSAVDVTFMTIVFSLIATGVFYIASKRFPAVPAAVIAFVLTCACGLLWRRYLRSLLSNALRTYDVSWSDDDATAFASIITNSRFRMSQLAVLHEDGTWYRCDNLKLFEDAPFGPCKIGAEGDVAIYLTHTRDADGNEKEINALGESPWGDRITVIPASKIKMINFRHTRR